MKVNLLAFLLPVIPAIIMLVFIDDPFQLG